MTPSVSVVMPARDAASTLEPAIASVRQQTLEAWELIIVDDGSSDGSRAVAECAALGDSRIRVIATPPRGIVAALNDGCAAARAPLIARLDADDLMRPTRLDRQMALLAKHPEVGLVATTVEFGGDPVRAQGLAEQVAWSNALLTHEAMSVNRFVEAPVVHPSVMFRRALLTEHGGYADTGEPEDWELWLRWLHAGVRFAKIDEPLTVWSDSPDRLTRTDPRCGVDRHARLRCRYLALHLTAVRERRALWLWGAGRVTRRRFDRLAEHRLRIDGFIDIDPRKIGHAIDGRPVVGPDGMPPRDEAFVIVGVGSRGARAQIVERLCARGRVEGEDFLCAG